MSNWSEYSLKSYQQPLNLVPEDQLGEYVSVLEGILDERLEELDDPDTAAVFRDTEREVYESLLESLDEVDDKLDLYFESEQAVETESIFPEPFDHLGLWSNTQEFLKSDYLEEVFDEAQNSLEDRRRFTRNNP
ncbi:hypothetical protein GKQ38_03825 [Candidatus Nanohaloarchaea archaeon]|nr:hypothetical protein GKQ38_03825 [Candidatus Nanohaloarchaea archaeon]